MGVFRQFPYSNFHEMNMDEIIKIVKNMYEEWETTKAEWASYKEYIDNYFANLDVSEEVLQALRIMAEDGTLNDIIDPVIASTTTEWLVENITQPVGVVIDRSLTVSGACADAKSTGEKLRAEKYARIEADDEERSARIDADNKKVNIPLNPDNTPNYGTSGQVLRTLGDTKTEWADIGQPTIAQVNSAVNTWLNNHPEATTTVADHSLTYVKLVNGTLNYVTPEMFGAVGDGITDDTDAIETATQNGIVLGNEASQYYISRDCELSNDVYNLNLKIDNTASVVFIKNNLNIENCNFENDTYAPSDGRGKWMIILRNSSNINVKNCYFHKGVSALYVDRCANINIHNNIFEDLRQYNLNGYGILFIESRNAIVANNVFIDVARHSIYISKDSTSTYNEDILIDSNIFKWDASVYGNSTGFENTINILPAKNITISNNKFINMFGITSLGVTNIYDDNVEITAAPINITIVNNTGSFANNPRVTNGGVIFVPGVSNDVQVENITVKNNYIELDQGIFFCIDNQFNDIVIENNVIKYGNAYWSQVFNMPAPNVGGESGDLTISGNRVTGANDLICVRTNPHVFGNVSLTNNDIDVVEIGNIKENSTFDSLTIANNIINSTNNRTYWSSCVVGELTLKNNIANQIISLWLAPTAVKSTDPVFKEYGFNNTNPTGCIAGSIHTRTNGEVYIMNASNTWVQI